MKKLIHILLALAALAAIPVLAETSAQPGTARIGGDPKTDTGGPIPSKEDFAKLSDREVIAWCKTGQQLANKTDGTGQLNPRVNEIYVRVKAYVEPLEKDAKAQKSYDDVSARAKDPLRDKKLQTAASSNRARASALRGFLGWSQSFLESKVQLDESKARNAEVAKKREDRKAAEEERRHEREAAHNDTAPGTSAGNGTKGAGEVLTKYPTPFGKGWVAASDAEKALIPNSGDYPVYKYEPDGHFMIWYISRFILIQNKYGAVDVKDTERNAARAAEVRVENANILKCSTADRAERERRKAAGIYVPPMSPAEAAAQKAGEAVR